MRRGRCSEAGKGSRWESRRGLAIRKKRPHIPNGKDAASLGQARLLLDTANSLFEDGGDLSRRGLGVGGVGPGLDADGGGCGISDLGVAGKNVSRGPGDKNPKLSATADDGRAKKKPSTQCGRPIESCKTVVDGSGRRPVELGAGGRRGRGRERGCGCGCGCGRQRCWREGEERRRLDSRRRPCRRQKRRPRRAWTVGGRSGTWLGRRLDGAGGRRQLQRACNWGEGRWVLRCCLCRRANGDFREGGMEGDDGRTRRAGKALREPERLRPEGARPLCSGARRASGPISQWQPVARFWPANSEPPRPASGDAAAAAARASGGWSPGFLAVGPGWYTDSASTSAPERQRP